MKRWILTAAIALGILTSVVIAEDAKKEESTQVSVPEKFVPGSKPMKGESAFDGAAYMSLTKGGPPGPHAWWMQARSGIGDKFPVQKELNQPIFEVRVAAGDDEHLILEILEKGAPQKIELKKDKPVEAKVAGEKYEFYYPTLSKAGVKGEILTTPKATIMVTLYEVKK
jgi:hypothetical protein